MENKCNEQHIAIFCLTDKSDTRIKTKGYQCVCLECDKLLNIKDNIESMNNVVYRKTDLDPFMEYMNIVRNEYRHLIEKGLTPIEAVEKINEEKEEPKQLKKTTNN